MHPESLIRAYNSSATFRSVFSQLTLFPIHRIENGACACSRSACRDVGKHPAVCWRHLGAGDQVKADPTNGEGYGIATGHRSRLFVVDLDSAEANERFNERGDCPDTFTVATAKGWHLYFELPNFAVRSSRSELAPGIDIRGEGGYVVCPGSPHRTGALYDVVHDVPIVAAAAWLLAWKGLRRPNPKKRPAADLPSAEAFEAFIGGTVPKVWRIERARAWLATRPAAVEGDGGEKRTWNTLLCVVKSCGLTDVDMAVEALEDWNDRCDPPWEGHQWTRSIERAIESDRVPWNAALDLAHAAETTFRRTA